MNKKELRLYFASAQFTQGAKKLSDCPPDSGQEVAFAGRSNAGKSSAINALTEQQKLARTSKTPGRTQMINFFALASGARLVDLPGHGYAKVPVSVQQHWQQHLDKYLRQRKSLAGMVLVSDIRHPMQEFDQAMLDWTNSCSMPLLILLSKSDKLKYGAAKNALLKVQAQLKAYSYIQVLLFSASKGNGVDEARAVIQGWLNDPTQA